jgi:hypothetical protein
VLRFNGAWPPHPLPIVRRPRSVLAHLSGRHPRAPDITSSARARESASTVRALSWRYPFSLARPITKLPIAEHATAEWQVAMESLILVVEHNGPTMMARIGVMRALNRHVERVFNPDRKDHHWGQRKLKSDQ